MAKVFRLHKGNDTILDWQDSAIYGSDAINQIKDPDGETARKEITSIPSPFARIDLVKTAFRKVTESPGDNTNLLDGSTINHKMISDSLDVGEIFFNVDKLKDKIEIIIWDRASDLAALKDSKKSEHKLLGKTLDLYLSLDAQTYNFDKLERFYLLNYIGPGKPAQVNIIGATSPATLFFSSANNLEYISKYISFGQDRPFDGVYQPLYKRDIEYQKYLYALRVGVPDFAVNHPELDRYLNLNYQYLSDSQKTIIDSIDSDSINRYEIIAVGNGNNFIKILDCPVCKKESKIPFQSDFEVCATIPNEIKPLILPVEAGNKYTDHSYVSAHWGKNSKAPFFDDASLQERVLPDDGSKYPYLTISDFLEDRIVRMPYELNTKFFFDGNLSKSDGKSYLLPLTNLFFQYFTVDDLRGQIGGEKMIEMKPNAGGLSVTLRIPIRKGYIEYRRFYNQNKNEPNLKENEGVVIDNFRLGLGLMPGIKFSDGEKSMYRIAVAENRKYDVRLSCGNRSDNVEPVAKVVRRDVEGIAAVTSYVVEKPIDRINISLDIASGVIIPKLSRKSGQSEFTFAIDFGTTNTHIEYSVDGDASKAFDVDTDDIQIQRLHLDYALNQDIKYSFENYFLPDTIGNGSLYSLPIRTVYADHENVDYTKPTWMLASGNIPFRYGKADNANQVRISTDLKWTIGEQERVRLYLENLYFLMRNKVLINGGNLDKTKIIWFYPASMTEAQINKFKEIWHSLYREYFGDNCENVITMSESVAPYNYYNRTKGAKRNVVTIDIGGETTDVYVIEDKQPKMLSSFRFASNAIFGDGYNWDSDNNGFVNAFSNDFRECLSRNQLTELEKAFSDIEKTKKSADIIAFLFSLAENKEIKNANIRSLDFARRLSDHEQLKYSFIIFYAAILYYVANLIKTSGLAMPLTIAFSGNGSKSLKVLSSDNRTLAKFIKLIFESVCDECYIDDNDLDIIYENNPKEATCKGGIINPVAQDPDSIDNLKSSLLGCDMSTFSGTIAYENVDDTMKKGVVQEVNKFIDFVFNIHNTNDSFFSKKFHADPKLVELVKNTSRKNLTEYLIAGLEHKEQEIRSLGAASKIEETMFFYPLIGMLNNLAREIINKSVKK